jgi:hypothetical protein
MWYWVVAMIKSSISCCCCCRASANSQNDVESLLMMSIDARFGASRLLLPVNICCANKAFYGDFFMFRFTFEEGAWDKVPKTVRTFAILLLNNISLNQPENL